MMPNSSQTLKNDLILFRGISPGVAASVLDNAEYREPAFASTSYDITLSLDAFGPRSPDGYRNMIVLEKHAGDHALYVNEDEREFLLPRGTRWHVVEAVNVGEPDRAGRLSRCMTARYNYRIL